MKKTFRVLAKCTTYFYLDIEANTREEAENIVILQFETDGARGYWIDNLKLGKFETQYLKEYFKIL